MTKRISRISDAALIRIEADLAHLDAEYVKVMDNPDPALEGFINGLLDRTSALEHKALARVPSTIDGLAVQARIAGRTVMDTSAVEKLIASIQAFAGEPAPKPGLRLRHGKRYRDRNGNVTAPMDAMDSRALLFGDNCSGLMYEIDGRCISTDRIDDLIEEVAPTRRPMQHPPARVHAHDAREERVAA